MSSLHISQDLENKIKTIKVNNSDNSTKWNNLINDVNTENTSDSLIPVITNEGSMQHTTIPNLVSRGNAATTSTNGLMSSEDKTNLNRATSNRTLWSGAWYMHGTQQAYLSETVSSQPTGIVLIWSAYDDGTARNYNYRSTFVPKQFVSLHNGAGLFEILGGTNGIDGWKYFYVYDDRIEGNDANNPDVNGNGRYVLREVIGV